MLGSLQVNASTVTQEKMKHQTLDEFQEVMRIMMKSCASLSSLKAGDSMCIKSLCGKTLCA